MARRDPTRETMERLARFAADGQADGDEAAAFVVDTLRAKTSGGHAVASAARFAANHGLVAARPELVAAWDRLRRASRPAQADPGAAGKAAILDALDRFEYDDWTPFVDGIGIRQMEPVFGGFEDVAAPVRARAAAGLVRLNHPGRHVLLCDLLYDPRLEARLGAAAALAYDGGMEAALLLRAKLRAGDAGPDVAHLDDGGAAMASACLEGLLRMDPGQGWPIVDEWLAHDDPRLAQVAALAAGETRSAEGFKRLKRLCASVFGPLPDEETPPGGGALGAAWKDPEARRTLCLGMALLRTDEAMENIKGRIRRGGGDRAEWERVADEVLGLTSWK